MTRRHRALAPLLALLASVGACSFVDPLSEDGLFMFAAPRDSALYVGAQLQAYGIMLNNYGDVYPTEHAHFNGLDSAVSVSHDGVVTARALGRARLIATRGRLSDTTWLTVVPPGTLAMSTLADVSVVTIMQMDGSGVEVVAPAGQYGGGEPAWLPGNAGIVYQYAVPGGAGGTQLFVSDFAGHQTQLLPYGRDPRVARDGSWVYFLLDRNIWRVHPDGSGPEQVTSTPAYMFLSDGDPDPSPDGSLLALRRTHYPDDGGFQLVIHTLATGAERILVEGGLRPRWAPDGRRLAYWKGDPYGNHGAIWLIAADGTGSRQVSAPGHNYLFRGLDWSPDGQWLVARSDSTLDLIQVATGLTLPLGYSGELYYPSWRWSP